MSKLAAIKKQIAALEAEAAKIAQAETAAAIAKVKEIMASFGLTAEHLGLAAIRGKRGPSKKSTPKRPGAGTPKYADPKTGKTWSGLGRVPAWIAGAKNRDAFLVDKSGLQASEPAPKAPRAPSKTATKTVKAAKPAAKKSALASKKAAAAVAAPATPAAKKRPAAKKASKALAKKASSKKATPAAGAAASQTPEATPSAGE